MPEAYFGCASFSTSLTRRRYLQIYPSLIRSLTLCFSGRVVPVTSAIRSGSFTRARLSSSSAARVSQLSSGRRRLAAVKSAATQHCRIRADVWRPCPTSVSSPSTLDARGVQALAVADPAKSSDGPKRNNRYPHKDIESKWQAYWSENQTFRTPDQVDTSKPKFYALDMFPYPRCMPLFCRTPWKRLRNSARRDRTSLLVNGNRKPFSLTYSELPCHLLEQWRRSSCRSSRRLYCDRYYSAIQAHDWTQCPSSYGLGRFWPPC